MSAAEYETGARRLAPAERAQELQRLEQERQREAERERERLAKEAQARQAREAALAARPLGQRLVEARCGACHPADRSYFATRGRTTLGWWVTVLRMEVLHGARIGPGERAPIVAHLASSQPATPAREATEWLLAALVAAGFAGLVLRWSRRRR
jgi:mono/diheme cytochrome c family protein